MKLIGNDSPLGLLLGKIFNIVTINILFIIFCLPVFTFGASLSAMYYACIRMFRSSNTIGWKDFIEGFKQNFKQSTIVTMTLCLCWFILFVNYLFNAKLDEPFRSIHYYLATSLMLISLTLTMYIFPVIASFKDSLIHLYKHCIFFAMKKPGVLIALWLMNILPLFLTYQDLALIPLSAFIWFFFGFATVAYINSFLLTKLFTPYL